MKKFFLTLFLAGGIFVLLSQGELLWSRYQLLNAPRVHKVQKGESLSKLAKQYYGDPQHWRELALINRAPKPGHLEVGEEILLPSANVIDELRRSRTVTRVNALVGEQEKVAVRSTPESAHELTSSETPSNGIEPAAPIEAPTEETNGTLPVAMTPETITPQEATTEESGFPWFWLAISIILIAGVAGFIWYRRKQAEENAVEIEMVEPRRSFNQAGQEAHHPFGKSEREKENFAV
jgi:LysM repeat protein